MRIWTGVVIGVLLSSQAFAQSTYVAGAIGAEVVKTTTVTATGSTFDNGSGETIAASLRVGTFVTPRLGVELEFHRPGEIEGDMEGPIYTAANSGSLPVGTLAGDGLRPDPASLSLLIAQTSRRRTTTVSALAVLRHGVGTRVDLVYLGGVGFSRVVQHVEFGIPRGPYSTRTTQYGAGPVVGVEARVGMTDHVRLTAGIRLHSLGQGLVDGWLIRPGVGLGWTF